MKCVKDSDLMVAIGTPKPFGTTLQYGMQYWDTNKPLIQIDSNRMPSVSAAILLPVHGDAAAAIKAMNEELDYGAFRNVEQNSVRAVPGRVAQRTNP